MRLLERIARRRLRGALNSYQEELLQLRERNAELSIQVDRQAIAFRRLSEERDRLAGVVEGTVQARLEAALLRRWADLSIELDASPVHGPASPHAGQLICQKVPLHSPAEVARFIVKVRRDTGYPEDLEGYFCSICPRHKLIGRVRHVRHRESQLDQRHLTGAQRGELRARESLTQPLAPELLARVRAQLATQTAEFRR